MTRNIKISATLVAIALVVVVGAVLMSRDDAPSTASGSAGDMVVRSDSLVLSDAPDPRATFVEFLDFECEACRAAYPAVEELRDTYGDQVDFVIRHMPLHANSVAAARAVEAAAAQGELEAMYSKLFETQPQWGEKQTSQEEVFFGFAEELGLDMDRFQSVYDDPDTVAKVERDQADGRALGVTGTPTFFLDGERLEISSYAELLDRIDDAIAS